MSDVTSGDATVVSNLAAAVADQAQTNLILVQLLGNGVRPQSVEVPATATLTDVLAAAGLSVSEKVQYTQGAAALSKDTPVRATSEAGPVVVSRAGANG